MTFKIEKANIYVVSAMRWQTSYVFQILHLTGVVLCFSY